MKKNDMGAVVISGASTGIGQATALLLDQAGYKVFAGVRTPQAAEDLQTMASERLVPLLLDITNPTHISGAVRAVLERLPAGQGLIGLVNNASVASPGPLEFLPLQELRYVLEVNIVGHIAMTQAFLDLIRQGKGRIINIGSAGWRLATPFQGAYTATKAAMYTLTNTLRRELAFWGIHVAIIEPGLVDTPFWDRGFAAAAAMEADLQERNHTVYAAALRAGLQIFQKRRGYAAPPSKTAAVIRHVLETPRPRPHYAVGVSAHIGIALGRFFPLRVEDWLTARQLSRGARIQLRDSGANGRKK